MQRSSSLSVTLELSRSSARATRYDKEEAVPPCRLLWSFLVPRAREARATRYDKEKQRKK